jgi:hypothetical protein
VYHWGRKAKGYQKTPFLAINAKGGEILSPKQNDRTTKLQNFRNDDFCLSFQMISYDENI